MASHVINIDSDDDEVEFVGQSSPRMDCEICHQSISKLTLEQRQQHYESHFAQSKPAPAAPSRPNMGGQQQRSQDTKSKGKGNVFWIPAHGVPPPAEFTPGLIALLRRALVQTHAKGATRRAFLCREGVCHVKTELWDITWGCGYRNFLMACTALMEQDVHPEYFPLLDAPRPPGLRNLQYWIEDAWNAGFDREGARDLRHKLVGTSKWIGTAELYVAFASRSIPSKLVDFSASNQAPERVLEWIYNYFCPPNVPSRNAFDVLKGATPVTITDKMPLILQHAGHSRTVVGIEVGKSGGMNLLVFDPAREVTRTLRNEALISLSYEPVPSTGQKLKQMLKRRHVEDVDAHEGKDHSIRKRIRRMTVGSKDGDENHPRTNDGGSSPEKSDKVLEPSRIVNVFRVTPKDLSKHDQYQILWFPLDPPLTDEQRQARKVVTSTKVQ